MFEKLIKFVSKKPASQPGISGKRILVVDDGEVERKFISSSLEKIGLVVRTEPGGIPALNRIKDEKFDLIILDFFMPDLNGKEVCLRLKAENATKDIPVIFLTGSASPADLIDCYDAGAEYYLSKPISAKELIKQVTMILTDLADETTNKA
jgi:CheY-like chemotaxis protein